VRRRFFAVLLIVSTLVFAAVLVIDINKDRSIAVFSSLQGRPRPPGFPGVVSAAQTENGRA